MNRTIAHRARTLPLTLLVLVALIGTVVAVTLGHQHADATGNQQHDHSMKPATSAQVAFHDQMRKLWEDHVTWTRLAIVEFADGSTGFDATASRLLQNQTDIGNAIKPFYGDAAGTQLTSLLRDHITIAVEILQSAKAGDTATFRTASNRWYHNANDIAGLLTAANPRFWPGGPDAP
jgi:hypothetical protein